MDVMTVRPATLEDLTIIQQLNHKLFLHDFAYDNALNKEWSLGKSGEEYFKDYLVSQNKVCLIIVHTEVCGYLAGSMVEDATRKVKVAVLDNMFVDKDKRMQGLGRQLFSRFTGWAKQKGADRIDVSAYVGNAKALGFYSALGFTPLAQTLEFKITISSNE